MKSHTPLPNPDNNDHLNDLLIDESLAPAQCREVAAESASISQSEGRMTNPDAVFIGAGPVGLFAAIQLKLRHPGLNILMLEKYAEFQRKHPLLIDHSSFSNIYQHAELKGFVAALPSKIRTSELQKTFLEFAKKLGIIIEYQTVDDCFLLQDTYPGARAFCGTDGSHSIVHKQVFNGEYQHKSNMRYICEVKYDVKGKTKPLNLFTQVIPVHAYANHLVSEFVGKEREGNTPVSIRIFIDEATYLHMKKATFKNPYKINSESENDYDPKLLTTIKAWLAARETFAKESRVENSEKVTVTNLPVYASNSFVAAVNDVSWALLGDSAIGVPYFRSLNNGLLCASEYAKCVDAYLRNIKEFEVVGPLSSVSYIPPMLRYRQYVQGRFEAEKSLAGWKDWGVEALESGVSSQRAVPLFAMSKFSSTEEGRLFKARANDERKDGPDNDPNPTSGCTIS